MNNNIHWNEVNTYKTIAVLGASNLSTLLDCLAMGFSAAVLFCVLLAASVSYSTLLVRPIGHESPVITLIGTTREATSSTCSEC